MQVSGNLHLSLHVVANCFQAKSLLYLTVERRNLMDSQIVASGKCALVAAVRRLSAWYAAPSPSHARAFVSSPLMPVCMHAKRFLS